ncbi:MAG: glucosamine-6-phosphate deaminase [Planctomycetota bacterium]
MPSPADCRIEIVQTFDSAARASRKVANQIAELIQSQRSAGRTCVLGLATGSTPISLYAELVRMHKKEGLSFGNVTTFNLDEYLPMPPAQRQSYVRFMHEHLFDHVDIAPTNIHIPDGTLPVDQVEEFCRKYECLIEAEGGIDLQLLGIGRTGHIGFNEPDSSQDSRTRLVTLDPITRGDASTSFDGIENVPVQAITMGVGTIMDAKKIIMMAFGNSKAPIVARTLEGPVDSAIPATFLKLHPNVEFVLDSAAASKL